MIGAFLASAFQNNAFLVGDQYGVWGASGGIEKRKNKVKRNERPQIESAIADAIDKITGVHPSQIQTAKNETTRESKLSTIYEFDSSHLEQQAIKLNQTIEEYKATLIRAELDDEEALLLLL